MKKHSFDSKDSVAETLLFALNVRAAESRKPDAMLHDERAIKLVEEIDYDFSRFKLNPLDQVTAILRVRQFDRITQEFIAHHPRGIVVHVGCGLDTRFERVDNGQIEWYDLDLPEVISLRQQLIPAGERCHVVGCSILDQTWLNAVPYLPGQKYLFLAEGVFPYFTEKQVRQVFILLADRYPGSELVCDGMSSFILRLHNLELRASKLGARLKWGLKNGRVPEAWEASIRLSSEWFYFDQPEPRLGYFQLMRYLPGFNKGVGIYHYQLGLNAG